MKSQEGREGGKELWSKILGVAASRMEKPEPSVIAHAKALRYQAKLGIPSLRRLADKRMRAFCIANNIPLSKVDAKLGWKQTEHRLNMQEHYDEEDLRSRMKVDARAT